MATTKDRLIRWLIIKLQYFIARLYAAQDVPVWRSMDGRVTPVNLMDRQHIVNTIRMLLRGGQADNPTLPFLYAELKKRDVNRARQEVFKVQQVHKTEPKEVSNVREPALLPPPRGD